jgi:hypothetical protein
MPLTYLENETQQQPLQRLSQINNIDEELIVFDNDFLMSCTRRICLECGSDHSFRPTFEGVKTSIDILPKLLQRKNSNSKEKIQEVIK